MNIKKIEEMERRDKNPSFKGSLNPNKPSKSTTPPPPMFKPSTKEK